MGRLTKKWFDSRYRGCNITRLQLKLVTYSRLEIETAWEEYEWFKGILINVAVLYAYKNLEVLP